MELYKDTVKTSTLEMLDKIMKDPEFKDFYLGGGTALSLQLGHRISIDLDFFSQKVFDKEKLQEHIAVNYKIPHQSGLQHGVVVFQKDLKIDFQHYPFNLVRPVIEKDDIKAVSPEDNAAMKLEAIASDGSRIKDFIDIYYLSERKPLNYWVEAYRDKFGVHDQKELARVAESVGNHYRIDFGESYTLTDKQIKWEKIAEGLKQESVKATESLKNAKQPLLPKKRDNDNKKGLKP